MSSYSNETLVRLTGDSVVGRCVCESVCSFCLCWPCDGLALCPRRTLPPSLLLAGIGSSDPKLNKQLTDDLKLTSKQFGRQL